MEGFSIDRPPFCFRNDYFYWKNRMTWFLKSIDLWDVIEDGPHIPTKIENGVVVSKPKQEWDEVDRKKVQSNAKVIHYLYCAIDRNEYGYICQCKSAKDIWRLLEIIHEGNNKVKESKINILMHSYELFFMKDDESIVEMFTRFTNIINELQALGKVYTESEKVMKILRSLPKKWEIKLTVIQEAKDLTKLPLEKLIGSLMAYEITMKSRQKVEDMKKKSIIFKASIIDKEEEEEASEEDEDLALIIGKFKKFIRFEKEKEKKFYPRKDSQKKELSNVEKRRKT